MNKLPKDVKTEAPILSNSTLMEENPNYKIMDEMGIQKRNEKVKAFVDKYSGKKK